MTTAPNDDIFAGTTKLAPFNPTCEQAQKIACDMLQLNPQDTLFDLGCGDGRFLRYCADHGFTGKAVGVEMDSVYVQRAKAHASYDTIDIRQGDVLDAEVRGKDFQDEATAIFLYLLPKGLALVRPILLDLAEKRKAQGLPFRVASYMFSIKDVEPVIVDRRTKGECPVYLYQF